jgi:hypothetical protein
VVFGNLPVRSTSTAAPALPAKTGRVLHLGHLELRRRIAVRRASVKDEIPLVKAI